VNEYGAVRADAARAHTGADNGVGPGALTARGRYLHDILYVSLFAIAVSVFTDYAWAVLLLVECTRCGRPTLQGGDGASLTAAARSSVMVRKRAQIPAFAGYKLWTLVLQPWLFAPRAEAPAGPQPMNRAERRKAEKAERSNRR